MNKISAKSVSVLVTLFLSGTYAMPNRFRCGTEPVRQVKLAPEMPSTGPLHRESTVCEGRDINYFGTRRPTPPLLVTRTHENGEVFIANQVGQVIEVSRGLSSDFSSAEDRRATPAAGPIGVVVAGTTVIVKEPIQEINVSRSMAANFMPIVNRRGTAPLNADPLFPHSTRGSTDQLGDASYFVRGSCPAEELDGLFYRNLEGNVKPLREKSDQSDKKGKPAGVKVRRIESSVAFLNWNGEDIPLEYVAPSVGSVRATITGPIREKSHFKLDCIYENEECVLKIFPGDNEKPANCWISGFICELTETANGQVSFIAESKWELVPARSSEAGAPIMELRGITWFTKAICAMEKLCISVGSRVAKPGRRLSMEADKFATRVETRASRSFEAIENGLHKSLDRLTNSQSTSIEDIAEKPEHKTVRV